MINPNQTKSVFWLIIILAVCAALGVAGYAYYKKHQNSTSKTETVKLPAEENPQEEEDKKED